MLPTKTFLKKQNSLLLRLTCFFWLIAKIISYKLWLSDRLFPVVPPFDFLQIPSYLHYVLFGFSILTLLLLIISPSRKILQIAVIVIEILSCLFDQNRWQPWEYQYIFIIFIFLINRKYEKSIRPLFIFMLASMYFYSGLGKLNPVFLKSIWYNLLLSKQFEVSYDVAHKPLIYYSGYLMGLIEIALALGLLFKKTQKRAAIGLIIMHVIILALFGPLGLDYDHVIWPWNILMILYFIILLRNSKYETWFKSKPLKIGWNQLVVVLFGIMPILSLFGKWDFFLSSSLFSSRPTDMYICMPTDKESPLNKYCDKSQAPCDANASIINVRSWAFGEMMAPAYPQKRVYSKIRNRIMQKFPNLGATYYIYTYKNGKKIKEELK